MSRLAGSAKLLRAMNSSATLAHLLQAGQLTRAELRERTGLSKPTSSEMLRLLTDAGLAVVTGRTAGSVGPTAEIYAPNGDAAYAVAVSIRDTQGADRPELATAVCDLNSTLRDRAESRVAFSRTDPATAVARAVTEACARAGCRSASAAPCAGRSPGLVRPPHRPAAPRGRARLGPHRHSRRDPRQPRSAGRSHGRYRERRQARRHRRAAPRSRGRRGELLPALAREPVSASRPTWAARYCADHAAAPVRSGTSRSAVGTHRTGAAAPGICRTSSAATPCCALAAKCGIAASTPGDAVSAAVAGGVDQFLERLAHRIAFALATVVAVLDPPLVVLAGEVAQAGGARLRDAVAAALPSTLTAPAATPAEPRNAETSGRTDYDVQIAVTAVDDDAVLLGGLDAGLAALHESLISSLAQPSLD